MERGTTNVRHDLRDPGGSVIAGALMLSCAMLTTAGILWHAAERVRVREWELGGGCGGAHRFSLREEIVETGERVRAIQRLLEDVD
ncbi:hypothetical protein [Streptomyces sp. URMC 123]|uniref:hypothetical protein n=1 Tax=Streptomyces sp. URMC 123 TaxID=3423403 RepID=UPI003F1D5CF6